MPSPRPDRTPVHRVAAWSVLVILLLVVPLVWSPHRLAVAAPEAPNIVVIMLDDLDWPLLEAALPIMPAVQELQARGTTLNQYFVTTPLCCPSRSSLLRGQYAHNHGVLWNRGEPGGSGGFEAFHRLGRETDTAATMLHDAGYRTGLFGKYLNGYPMSMPDDYVPPGWDDWAAHASVDREMFFYDYDLNVNGEIVHFGDAPEDYSTDVLRDFAIAFLTSAPADQPVFLMLTPYAPHSPSEPAARHSGTYAGPAVPLSPSYNEDDISDKPLWVRALPRIDDATGADIEAIQTNRLESLMAVNEMVQQVVDTLEDTGRLESTYLLFTSDNGFHYGEHRVPFGKVTPYDESVNVPMIIVGPGIPAGVESEALAANIDLLPTFLGWVGVRPPAFVDGRDLGGILLGATEPTRHQILIEQFEDPGERVKKGGKPGKAKDVSSAGTPTAKLSQVALPPFVALRGETFMFAIYQTDEIEFYDLVTDPFALDNRAADLSPEAVAQLTQLTNDLAACSGASCRDLEDLIVEFPLSSP